MDSPGNRQCANCTGTLSFPACAKNFDSEIAGVDDSGVADSELKLHSCNFSGPNIPSSSTYYVQFKFNFTACFQRQKKKLPSAEDRRRTDHVSLHSCDLDR